jgi:hypothetical protein
MESVTTAEEARIREDCAEDLVGACTEELLAQPRDCGADRPVGFRQELADSLHEPPE